MKTEKRIRLRPGRLLAALLLLLIAAFLLYAARYYPADETALRALQPDAQVQVTQTDYGWFFDGPSEKAALIFYPGGKVEETAYAPLLRLIAGQGTDVCLLHVPLHLAVLAPDRADTALALHDYETWYIGGHSLGGAIAANYAADHPGLFRGLLLLAAYPTHPLDEEILVLTLVGSEDGVVNLEKLSAGEQFAPNGVQLHVIPGGNHAQFGSYGPQKGDGAARISPEEQWEETAALLRESFG